MAAGNFRTTAVDVDDALGLLAPRSGGSVLTDREVLVAALLGAGSAAAECGVAAIWIATPSTVMHAAVRTATITFPSVLSA